MDDRTKLVESLGKKIDRVLDDNRRLRSEALGLTTERAVSYTHLTLPTTSRV